LGYPSEQALLADADRTRTAPPWSEFKADGLIELTPKHIRVLEPEKLRRARW